MKQRGEHDLSYISSVFDRISKNLNEEVTLYYIGGNAMCWYGLKDTTKDADLVFIDKKEIESFKFALLKSSFIEVEIVSDPEYRWIQPYGIFDEIKGTPLHEEFKPGIRIDLFLNQICGGLNFSEGMRKRSKPHLISHMESMVCSREDIFLFKSITGRERDLMDMRILVEKGLSWDVITDEFIDQLKGMSLSTKKVFVGIFNKSIRDLGRMYGAEIPISVLRRVNRVL